MYYRIKIELDKGARPEHLVQEATSVAHFLKDTLEPFDDELNVSPNGKWGIRPVIDLQLALLAKADDMLGEVFVRDARKLEAVNE